MLALLTTLLLAADPAVATAPPVPAPPAAPAPSAPPPVELTATAEPENVKLGDAITLVVTARHGTDVKLYFPAEPEFRPFRVLSTAGPERVMEGESVVETWRLSVQTLRLGKRRVAPFAISYEAGNGQVGTVMTPPVRVSVDGALDLSAKEHPVAANAAPFQVFDKNWALIIALIALAVVTVTAGITLVAARYVARLAPRGPPPPLPRPAHELAAASTAARRPMTP